MARDGHVSCGQRALRRHHHGPHAAGRHRRLAIIEALRKSGKRTPILILSALSEVDERIRGLRAGGDDYLTKPFAFGELLARLDALTRRAQGEGAQTKLEVGDLRMDLLTRKVTRGERNILLQPREFKLLEYLMRHADQVVTRTMLLENVWDYHFDPQTNVVDVHISKLRQKIDADFERPLLRTVRNAGYKTDRHMTRALLHMRFLRSSALSLAVGYIGLGLAALALFAAPLWYRLAGDDRGGPHRDPAGRCAAPDGCVPPRRPAGPDELHRHARGHADRRRAHLLLADSNLKPLAGNL